MGSHFERGAQDADSAAVAAQGVPSCPTRLLGPRVPFEAGRGL